MELLTVKDVCDVLKCSRPTLYRRKQEQPDFPRPIYFATRSPRWRADEIESVP